MRYTRFLSAVILALLCSITALSQYEAPPVQRPEKVVLHGRNNGLTEVSFLHKYIADKATPKELNHVQLDIFGRGNNAYRWAGETDVYEALENFVLVERLMNRAQYLDPTRFVLRGFS